MKKAQAQLSIAFLSPSDPLLPKALVPSSTLATLAPKHRTLLSHAELKLGTGHIQQAGLGSSGDTRFESAWPMLSLQPASWYAASASGDKSNGICVEYSCRLLFTEIHRRPRTRPSPC